MHNMRVFVYKDHIEIGLVVANQIAELLQKKPDAVLGLATGSSPEEAYAALISLYKAGKVSFKDVKTFNLDEYLGLGPTHTQSFRYFMEQKLFKHIDIDLKNIMFFDGTTKDVVRECRSYDRELKEANGIDFQLLGIGGNGHVAFNEPSNFFSQGSSDVELTEETRVANQRFFTSLQDVPIRALTMGMQQICKAKQIVLIACGAGKAEAVYRMLHGEVTPRLPASMLQTAQDVRVYVDEALRDYAEQHFGMLAP